jgi:hypothetical protein
MHLEKKLHENVYLYENVIEDPKKLLALLEELDLDPTTHSTIPEWGFWFSNSADGHSFGSKKDFNLQNLSNIESERKEDVLWIVDQIRRAVKNVAEQFYVDKNLEGTPNISPFAGIMKYREGCFMGPHFDAQAGDESLKYSIVVYLNNDYEGGEISFIIRPYDLRNPKNGHLRPKDILNDSENKERNLVDFSLKPKAGSALIFPSTHPYKHQVHTIISGDKYIFPGFIFVDDYNPDDPISREKYNAGSKYRDVNSQDIKYLDED